MEHDNGSVNNGSGSDHGTEHGGQRRGSNIILLGAMGSGKSTVGWRLAKLLGYGFLDFDRVIEAKQKKKIVEIFEAVGETEFRRMERELVASLRDIKSHVLSVGGGTVMDDESWQMLDRMGTTVWLNPPPEEIARRLGSEESEILSRPLLADLATHKDRETRHKLLSERMNALIGNRAQRYREAAVTISDSFSTPDSTALLIRDSLTRDGVLTISKDHRPFDRWRIL